MYQQGYRPPSPGPRRAAKQPAANAQKSQGASKKRAQNRPVPGSYTYSPGGTVARAKKPRSGAGRVLLLLLMLGVLVFGAFYLKTWLEVSPYDKLFAPNVFVDNIPLGGMKAADGVSAIRAHNQGKVDNLSIRLVANGTVLAEIGSSMLGITYDTDTALNAAWAIGHNGTVFDRKREMDKVRVEGFHAYSASPGGNTQPVDDLLVRLKNELYRDPQDASFSFDADASNPFSFTPEVQGRSLDIEPLKEEIYRKVAAMESGDIEVMPVYTQPEVTVETLQAAVSLRYRATTPIDPKSEENRTNNIRRAFELINGTVLKPGGKFSFNNIVGWRTEKNGFFPAPEYAYGELETGIGGGVCQASTTIYLAAIHSGLKIVDREPHSDPVSYTDFGKDATVYMTSHKKIDFVFQNNTEGDLYITAAVKTDPANRKRFICEVAIYGISLGDVSYELVARETKKLPAPTEPQIIKDKQHKYNLAPGEQHTTMKARDGREVVSELIKKVNGVEVERIPVDKDTYKARAARIYEGVE